VAPIVRIGVGALGFGPAHGYSLWWNERRDFQKRKPNLGAILFYPYLRVITMHLTIILASEMKSMALPFFVGLKSLSDCCMHLVEHALFGRGDLAPPRAGTGRER